MAVKKVQSRRVIIIGDKMIFDMPEREIKPSSEAKKEQDKLWKKKMKEQEEE